MQGYETKEQRDAHIKALVTELRDVKRAVETAESSLNAVPESRRVERAWREEELEKLTARVGEVEEQLRTFKGAAPHKRATKRDAGAVEKRA